jgi:hypothetical protein
MSLIVVSDILIAALDFLHEIEEHLEAATDIGEYVLFGQNVSGRAHQFVLLSELLHFEYIELQVVNLLHFILDHWVELEQGSYLFGSDPLHI